MIDVIKPLLLAVTIWLNFQCSLSEKFHDDRLASAKLVPLNEPQVTFLHQMVSAKNLIYIVGGKHGVDLDSLTFSNNPLTNNEDDGDDIKIPPQLVQLNLSQPAKFSYYEPSSSVLRSLLGHTVAFIDDRHIVSFFGKGMTQRRQTIFVGILRFDIEKNEWKEYRTHNEPDKRWGHTSVYDSVRKKVFLHGGILSNGTVDRTMYILSLDSRNWESHSAPSGVTIPHSIAFSSAVVLDKYYASCFGTNGIDLIPNNECLLFNIETNEFSQSRQENAILSRSHSSLAMSSQPNQLLVFGGVNMATRVTFRDAWILDGSQLPLIRWIPINASDGATSPSPRYGHSAVQLSAPDEQHFILVWGGVDLQGRGDTTLHVMDSRGWCWEHGFDGIFMWGRISKVNIIAGIGIIVFLIIMALLMYCRIQVSPSANDRKKTRMKESRSSKVSDSRAKHLNTRFISGQYEHHYTPLSSAASVSTNNPMTSRSSNHFSSLNDFQLPGQSYPESLPRMRQWKTPEEEKKLQQKALLKKIKEIPGKPAEYIAEKWSNLKSKKPFRRISKRRRKNELHQLLLERGSHTLCPQYDEEISACAGGTASAIASSPIVSPAFTRAPPRFDSKNADHVGELLPLNKDTMLPPNITMSLGRRRDLGSSRRLPTLEHRNSTTCFPASFGAASSLSHKMHAINEEAQTALQTSNRSQNSVYNLEQVNVPKEEDDDDSSTLSASLSSISIIEVD